MKRSIAIILSCMFLFLCVLSPCLSVKASSQTFTTDYSSLLSVSQLEGTLAGLTSAELTALYTSLGGLAYSYLQSVNIDVKASNQNNMLWDLGKQVLSFVFHPLDSISSYASAYVYDSLAANSQYFLSSLFKKVDNSTIDDTNYTSVTYDWKSVSSVMSDVFNSYNRVSSIGTPDPDAFYSASNLINGDYLNLYNSPSSSFINTPSNFDDIYYSIHFNNPSLFYSDNNSSVYYTSLNHIDYYDSDRGIRYNFDFDTILFPSTWDFSSNNVYYLVDSSNTTKLGFQLSSSFPLILYNSSSDTYFICGLRSSDKFLNFNLSNSLINYSLAYTNNTYYVNYSAGYSVPGSYNSVTYDLNTFANYLLGLSSNKPFGWGSNINFALSNINAYVFDLPSNNYDNIYLDSILPYSSIPLSINIDNVYQGSLQVPVDNAPGAVANLDIQSVIDAINDNSLVNNIDRLGSIISDGVVGSIPEVSIDSWNPDKVSAHATSSDIATGLDGLSAIEGTYVDNVAPVFETYPIVPFLQPIFEALGSNVISIIAVCIFIVVLFGFLNKLLF